jgi:hypothetical protein
MHSFCTVLVALECGAHRRRGRFTSCHTARSSRRCACATSVRFNAANINAMPAGRHAAVHHRCGADTVLGSAYLPQHRHDAAADDAAAPARRASQVRAVLLPVCANRVRVLLGGACTPPMSIGALLFAVFAMLPFPSMTSERLHHQPPRPTRSAQVPPGSRDGGRRARDHGGALLVAGAWARHRLTHCARPLRCAGAGRARQGAPHLRAVRPGCDGAGGEGPAAELAGWRRNCRCPQRCSCRCWRHA